jgi:uncharacterized protein YkwD
VYCKAYMQSKVAIIIVFLLSTLNIAAAEPYYAVAQDLNSQIRSKNLAKPDIEVVLFGLANAFRASKGKPALSMSQENVFAARAQALDMMQRKYVGHVARSGHDFESRMRSLRPGQMILPRMAENAARVSQPGSVDENMAAKLFQQWVKSPPHAHALLSSDYVTVATGAVSDHGVLYAVQIFSGPDVKTNMQMNVGQGLY